MANQPTREVPHVSGRHARHRNADCDGRRPCGRWPCGCRSSSSRAQATAISPSQTACVPEWQTHDDQRKGTTSLFAALPIATGKVTGKGDRHHRAVECKKFLALMHKSEPETHEVHLILGNDGTHKTARMHNGLRRPR